MTTTPGYQGGGWRAYGPAWCFTTGPMVLVGTSTPSRRRRRGPGRRGRFGGNTPAARRILAHERGPPAHASIAVSSCSSCLLAGRRRLHQCVRRLDLHAGATGHAGAEHRTLRRPAPPPPALGRRLGRPVGLGRRARPLLGPARRRRVISHRPGHRLRRRAVTVPAGDAFTDRVRQPGRGHPAQRRDPRTAAGAQVFKTDIFPGVEKRTYEVPALTAGTYTFVCTVHPNMTGTLTVAVGRGDDDRDRRAALLLGRLPPVGRGAGRRRSSPASATWSSSIGPSSTRAAAASPRIAACSCGPPTAGRGPSAPPARPAARSSTSSSPATAIRRRSATRSRWTSTGPAG